MTLAEGRQQKIVLHIRNQDLNISGPDHPTLFKTLSCTTRTSWTILAPSITVGLAKEGQKTEARSCWQTRRRFAVWEASSGSSPILLLHRQPSSARYLQWLSQFFLLPTSNCLLQWLPSKLKLPLKVDKKGPTWLKFHLRIVLFWTCFALDIWIVVRIDKMGKATKPSEIIPNGGLWCYLASLETFPCVT